MNTYFLMYDPATGTEFVLAQDDLTQAQIKSKGYQIKNVSGDQSFLIQQAVSFNNAKGKATDSATVEPSNTIIRYAAGTTQSGTVYNPPKQILPPIYNPPKQITPPILTPVAPAPVQSSTNWLLIGGVAIAAYLILS